MEKQIRKLLCMVLTAALCFTGTVFTGTGQAQAKAKKVYATRADVVTAINQLTGAAKTTKKIKNVTDVKKTDPYYKDMAIAMRAGLIQPTKAGKLGPEIKATYNYVSVILSRVTGISKSGILGGKKANARMTKSQLQAFINARIPNVISRSTSKVKTGNVIVNRPGVTLKNVTVDGNLIIGDGVADKEVTLENVKVTGVTVIRGGGKNSVIIKGTSSLSQIILRQVYNEVSLKIQGDAKVSMIYINDGSNDVMIVGAAGSVVVEGSDLNVNLSGADVKRVSVQKSAKNVTVNADEKSAISKLVISADGAKITGAGKVDAVSVAAENTVIDMANLDPENVTVKDGIKNTVVNGEIKEPAGGQNSGDSSTGGQSSGSDSGSSTNGSSTGGSGSSAGGSVGGSSTGGSGSSAGDSAGGSSTGGSGSSAGGSSTGGSGSSTGDSAGGSSTSGSGSSAGGSTGGSGSGEGGSGSVPQTTYQRDERFAEGYPKIEMNQETKELKVIYKLKEGVASEEKPAEIYNIVSDVNVDSDTDTTAVLHGHLGIAAENPHEPVSALDIDYFRITDAQEHSGTYFLYSGLNEGIVIYSVVKDADEKLSSVPTKTKVDGDIQQSFLAPYLRFIYRNQAGDKLYAYCVKKFDLNSTPDAECFTVRDIKGVTVATASAVAVKDAVLMNHGLVELTLEPGQKLTGEGPYYFYYQKPEKNALQDTANIPNQVNNISGQEILRVKDVNPTNHYGISEDGQCAYFAVPAIIPKGNTDIFTAAKKQLVVEIDGQSYSLTSEKINTVKLVYGVAQMYIEINCKDLGLTGTGHTILVKPTEGEELYDMAFDPWQPVEIADLEIYEKPVVVSASYFKNQKRLVMNINDGSLGGRSSGSACNFVVQVDGKECRLRGNYGHDDSVLSIETDSLKHLNLPDDFSGEMKIKYQAEGGDFVANPLEQPMDSTDWIDVEIVD